MDALPSMKASELQKRAASFARDLAEQLEKFNSENPEPQMDEEARHRLKTDIIAQLPTPGRSIGTFETVFCRYMASRSLIIPE